MEFNVIKLRYDFSEYVYYLQAEDILPATSIVWEECYNRIGKCQIVLPRSVERAKNIALNDWIYIQGAKTLMMIHGIKYTDTEIWLYGYEAKGYMQKVGMTLSGFLGGTEPLSTTAIRAWVTMAEFTEVLAGEEYTVPTMRTATVDALDALDLYHFLEQVCDLDNCGLRLSFDRDASRMLKLEVYRGADKSDTARFAPALGNIRGIEYSQDNQNNVRSVLVVGMDGNDEVLISAGGGVDSLYSRYIVDLRTEYPRPDDMTRAEYDAALMTRAQATLNARSTRTKFEVKNIDTRDYSTKYELGDIVRVEVPELNISRRSRVKTVRRTIEGSREKIDIDLGEWM